MPAVQLVSLVGGTWLTADAGAALFDGRPARRSRIGRTGALAVNIVLAEAIVPGVIAVLGLNVPAGVAVRAAGASGVTVRLPSGSVCAWLFPTLAVPTASVTVEIDTAVTNVDIGEVAVLRAVDVGISDGWGVATVDGSVHVRTKGGQVNTVAGAVFRRFTANLSARPTEIVRKGGLAGTDWETVAHALSGLARGCVVPQFRDMGSKAFDPVLAARSAIYGYAVQLPTAENVSRQYFGGYIEFEEIPT